MVWFQFSQFFPKVDHMRKTPTLDTNFSNGYIPALLLVDIFLLATLFQPSFSQFFPQRPFPHLIFFSVHILLSKCDSLSPPCLTLSRCQINPLIIILMIQQFQIFLKWMIHLCTRDMWASPIQLSTFAAQLVVGNFYFDFESDTMEAGLVIRTTLFRLHGYDYLSFA